MSEQARTCPRCGAHVEAERHRDDGGSLTMWRCACGWSAAKTDPVAWARGSPRYAIAKTLELLDREEDSHEA